ncbi:MAG TPA: hypothetical protein VL098_07175 [Flavipsychrobacter sp.]|nr:hypothetical protein [Flavipsychrobacter sp.]
MDSIQLYIDSDKILRLEFQEAIHPTSVHLKADHWSFVYKLYRDRVLFDFGLFNSNYFVCEERKVLIIEEYNLSILDKENIKVDEDVIKNLRLFDFRTNRTGRFSKLTGSSFLLQKIINDTFVFSKQYSDRTSEFEIDLASIPLFDFGRI